MPTTSGSQRKLERRRATLQSRSDEWVGAYCEFRQTRSNPDAETVHEARERFTETFADLIAERGYDERIERRSGSTGANSSSVRDSARSGAASVPTTATRWDSGSRS
jgi:hypothetical protein